MDARFFIENTELTLGQIATRLGVGYKVVWNVWKTYPAAFRKARKVRNYQRSKLGQNNPMHGKFGAAHHNFVGEVSDGRGYLMVLRPEWYTGRKRSKHVFAHHVVVCLGLGISSIPKGWCVHHCDEDPHNNDFSNLVLMTMADHTRLHQVMRKGATTTSKEGTLKWVEAHGTPFRRDDIVCSA